MSTSDDHAVAVGHSVEPCWEAAADELLDRVAGRFPRVENRPRTGRKPTHWTRLDRDYETPRINMQTLFHVLGNTTGAVTAAWTIRSSGSGVLGLRHLPVEPDRSAGGEIWL